jgi:glycosyltransferase involved in cell wall biosynthesis
LEVKKKYPDIKACIVGDGPRKLELTRLAGELGVTENVTFTGFQKDVPYYYNSSRIFIHTSETEGFPNVVLEAMMCGLPCVISNCGDIVDLAKDGFNSLVIQNYSDYQGFAKAICNLLEDEELYGNISRNALKSVEAISIENVTCQWKLLLDDMRVKG